MCTKGDLKHDQMTQSLSSQGEESRCSIPASPGLRSAWVTGAPHVVIRSAGHDWDPGGRQKVALEVRLQICCTRHWVCTCNS